MSNFTRVLSCKIALLLLLFHSLYGRFTKRSVHNQSVYLPLIPFLQEVFLHASAKILPWEPFQRFCKENGTLDRAVYTICSLISLFSLKCWCYFFFLLVLVLFSFCWPLSLAFWEEARSFKLHVDNLLASYRRPTKPTNFCRLASWFAYHLSNYEFRWTWEDWSDCLQVDIDHPKAQFVSETLQNCIRYVLPPATADFDSYFEITISQWRGVGEW